MSTRNDIVGIALSQNGYHDNQGYDELTKYTESFGINYGIAYCDIFVAWCFEQAKMPLPKMGNWIRSGSQYCPDSWAYAAIHGATKNSWEALPGDQVIFDWTGTGVLGGESHTEIVVSYSSGWLYTVGGNSGPSNVDGFHGVGGVHRHAWYAPPGVGNSLIMGVIDTSKLVSFSTTEELILTPEDKAFLEANFASKADVSQLVKVIEDGANHAYGMEGIKDVFALVQRIADHVGVK